MPQNEKNAKPNKVVVEVTGSEENGFDSIAR